MSAEENKAIVRRFIEGVFNKGSIDRIGASSWASRRRGSGWL